MSWDCATNRAEALRTSGDSCKTRESAITFSAIESFSSQLRNLHLDPVVVSRRGGESVVSPNLPDGAFWTLNECGLT